MSKKTNGMINEFKKFVMRGNVIDLAVGVIIGGAFGKIVTSLVNDLLMPLIGLVLGKVNFSQLKVVINPATETTPEAAIKYGAFLQAVLDFVIIALCIFVIIKVITGLQKRMEKLKHTEEKKAAPPVPPEPTKQELLLTEIRDLLKENSENRSKTEV